MFDTLGQYKVLERIGTGGLGDVFRARDTRHGRTVALKVLPPDLVVEAARRERFLKDARACAALSHPNIAALYEISEDRGRTFLVFEFVAGETLKAATAGRPLNPRRALGYAVQIADALADAHAAGVTHLDLKPDNILVTPRGNAKILDCGLASWTGGGGARDRAARATASAAPVYGETVARTVPYMSPEQAQAKPADSRSDIFSLGIVLFEMLTGKTPFEGPTPAAVLQQMTHADPVPPSVLNADLPRELDGIVLKMLARDPDKRQASAATVAAELRGVAAGLNIRVPSELPAVRAAAQPRRPALGWIVGALVLIALAGLVWLASRSA
jgi:serine/threonine protein kinase